MKAQASHNLDRERGDHLYHHPPILPSVLCVASLMLGIEKVEGLRVVKTTSALLFLSTYVLKGLTMASLKTC